MAKRKNTSLVHFGAALAEILGEYSELVDKAVQAGGDEAAQVFINHAVQVSPPDNTGEYRKSWAVKDSKSRYKRYVGNTKMVKGANSSTIPLINILEYSTVRGNKHVDKAIKASKQAIFDIYKKHLNTGGQ